MSTESIYQGGLLRCCLQTWDKAMNIRPSGWLDGDILTCEYCDSQMSDLTTYRTAVPEMVDPYVHSDTSLIQQLVDSGSLVPDTRLQAIADAWNEYTDVIKDEQLGTMEWLSVVALLDALTEENKT